MTKLPRIPKSPQRLINDLRSHLYFLRNSLIESHSSAIHYKEIANQLRALIYEKPGSSTYKPLLLILADKYGVAHSVHLDIPYPSQKYLFPTSGSGTIAFRDYLKLHAFGRKGQEVTAERLMVDLANQSGSAHEDQTLEEYLPTASVQIRGIPFHLEVLRDVGHQVLIFGSNVVRAAIAKEGSPTQDALGNEPLAPSPICPNCSQELDYHEFRCGRCSTSILPPPAQLSLAIQFENILKEDGGMLESAALLQTWLNIPQLFDRTAGQGVLLDCADKDVHFLLVRTADFKLEFSREDQNARKIAVIDLSAVTPSDWVALILIWSPDHFSIHLGAGDENLHSSYAQQSPE